MKNTPFVITRTLNGTYAVEFHGETYYTLTTDIGEAIGKACEYFKVTL